LRVFPVLKPAHWQGLAYGARAHVWIGTPENPLLLVAYGCFDGGLLSYVTNETSGYGHPDALVKEAFDNLQEHQVELQLVGAGSDQVLIAAGPLTAEQVLSEAHMLRAHDKLNADEIVVSVARRDAFMACAADASEQLRRTMAGLHHESWSAPGGTRERLFDQLIVFDRGIQTDTVMLGPEAPVHHRWGRWTL
jgi:hypothetical protein